MVRLAGWALLSLKTCRHRNGNDTKCLIYFLQQATSKNHVLYQEDSSYSCKTRQYQRA